MKLHSIRLQNFRSHVDTTITLDRLNIFRADNGGGKTSIAYALELALTGKCEKTSANGAGADELITTGQKQTIITLTFEGGATLTYKRTASGAATQIKDGDKTLVSEAAKQWIADKLAPIPVLSAVLNSANFLKLTEAQQKALLADALKPEPVEIDKDIVALEKELFADGGHFTQCSAPAQVDQHYKAAFDLRTDTNRTLKALGEITALEIPQDLATLEEVDSQIADLQQQRDAKVREKSQRLADFTISKAQYDLEQRKRQSLRQQKTDLLAGRTREAIETEALDDKRLAKLQKDLTASEKAGILDNRITANQETVTHKREEIANLKASIEKRQSQLAKLMAPIAPRTCGECGSTYTPKPVDPETIAEQERQIGREETLLKAAEKVLEDADKQLTTAQAERRKLGDPEQLKAIHEKHKKAIALLFEIDKLETQLTAEMPQEPTQPECPEDEEIIKLDERLKKGTDYRANVIRYQGQQEQYQKQVAQRDNLQQKANKLDRLCDYFGPKGGLKAKLIGGKLPAFRERMNLALSRFGFVCNFELEPYTLTVRQTIDNTAELERAQATGRMLPNLSLSQLSESQAYRFSIAFALAIAETTGVNFVTIDRADMLLPSARIALTDELLESRLEQALVLASGEPQESYPVIEGVRFFEIELRDGVSRVEPMQAVRELTYVTD